MGCRYKTPGFRAMRKDDCVAAHKLLSEYLKRFSLAPVFSREEFEHWLMPRENVVNAFVVEVSV